jgi:hypothetical protein
MKELDINALLSAMEKPATGGNIKNVMDMIAKADDFLKQAETFMNRLDRMGLKPLIVRGFGKQMGIDAETPLKTDNNFKSPTHEAYINSINNISEADLKKQLEGVTGGK